MNSLSDAIIIAANAHRGQVDKASQEYILHPLRVMMALQDEKDQICAVLHDVIEDTEITADDLKDHFPQDIIDTLKALTHIENENYESYIDRIILNERACRVKLSDLTDNMDLSRLEEITEDDKKRYKKYFAARNKIKSASDK